MKAGKEKGVRDTGKAARPRFRRRNHKEEVRMENKKASKVIVASIVAVLIAAMLLIGACAKRAPSPTPTTPTPAPAATPTPTPTPSPTLAAPIEIKSACFLPATHSIGGAAPLYVDMVNDKFAGKIKCNIPDR